jgi:stress-induced morphogen
VSFDPATGYQAAEAHLGTGKASADQACQLGEEPKTLDNAAMIDQSLPSRSDRLHATLTRVFSPTELSVQDDSAHHAGHAGAPAGGQSHYSVLLVTASFQGVSRVARSRAVHSALAGEFGPAEGGGMHALALTLRTPEEHAAQNRK